MRLPEMPFYQDIMVTRYPDRDYHLKVLDEYLINPTRDKTTVSKLRYQQSQTYNKGSKYYDVGSKKADNHQVRHTAIIAKTS